MNIVKVLVITTLILQNIFYSNIEVSKSEDFSETIECSIPLQFFFENLPEIDFEKVLDFPVNQNDFFNSLSSATALRLNIQNDVIILPTIGQLQHLQSIDLINWEYSGECYDVIIPLELLNLPNLKKLTVYGKLNLQLSSNISTSQIHSNIEYVEISSLCQISSIPFLCDLSELRQLVLVDVNIGELPPGFERLHNLRSLSIIYNSKPFVIDERICDLTNLELVELDMQLNAPLPTCFERLTNLKRVSMPACYRESLPDSTMVQFPVTLAALPNLEELNLWDEHGVEMPSAQYGFKNLKYLNIETYPRDMSYHYHHCSSDDKTDINLDAVADYPKLQAIRIDSIFDLDASLVEYIQGEPLDARELRRSMKILAIRRFLNLVDAAWKEGRLPDLRKIDMWDRSGYYRETITVWWRPETFNLSGIMLPTDNINWLLQKECGNIAGE